MIFYGIPPTTSKKGSKKVAHYNQRALLLLNFLTLLSVIFNAGCNWVLVLSELIKREPVYLVKDDAFLNEKKKTPLQCHSN